MGKVCTAITITGLLLVGQAHAKPADDLHQVEQKLSQEKQKQAVLDQKAKEASEGLRALRDQLMSATAAIEAKAEEEERLEDKLDSLKDDIESKTTAVAAGKAKLRLFSAALVEMVREPLTALFLKDIPTRDYIHRSILARALLPRVSDDVSALLRDLVVLHQMEADMAQHRKVVADARINLQKQQQDLDQLIKARQGILKRTEAEKAAIAKQLASLSSEAKDLRQLLDKIASQKQAKLAPPAPPGVGMKWPVTGTILHPYGHKDADGVVSSGITFSALPGSPIVAPRAGKVVFAGPFRGYGQILILQHGGGYHSFIAGFGRIDVDMGQDVETGEPLGVLPISDARRTELYFEWRRNNEPIEPR